MEKLIVHLDSDGPLTDLSTSWCANYNKKYNDNLPVSAFRDWVDIENLVKPECGEKVFDLMKEPGMFARLQPMPGAVECLKRLNANPKLDCYILTSYSGNPEIAHGKLVYFAKHFPFFDPQKIADKATYQNPDIAPEGIEYVLIGGEAAVFEGELLSVNLGKPIRFN